MPADPRLAALPALRNLAEDEARDIWTRHVRLFALHLPDMQTVADPNDASDGFFVTVEAQVERLADLSRRASRRAVADLVAEAVPNLQAWEVTAGCECGGGRLNMVLRACGLPELSRWEPDPVPSEALTLIALAVLS